MAVAATDTNYLGIEAVWNSKYAVLVLLTF